MVLTAENAVAMETWDPPTGYVVRGYESGDEDSWLQLMALAGFSGWDRSTFDTHFAEPERPEGSRVIVHSDQIVAAALASQRSIEPPVGGLDYVICDPEHKGNRLGCTVCAAVIRYLLLKGYREVRLNTDDWRLAAIKTYLKLGFAPDLCREDMPDRWQIIYQQLNIPSAHRAGLSGPKVE